MTVYYDGTSFGGLRKVMYHVDYCDHVYSKVTLRCIKCGKSQVTGRYD